MDQNHREKLLQQQNSVNDTNLQQKKPKKNDSILSTMILVTKESFLGLCSFEMQLLTLTLINVYQIGHSETPSLLVALAIGDIYSKMFGYGVIRYLHMGLLSMCSQAYGYNKNQKLIGIYYQRGLLISGLLCIALSPLFYLSDVFLKFVGIEESIATEAGNYIWVSLPSFYLFAYYDATKQLLYSQDKFGPPMFIQLGQVFIQFFMTGWFINTKNMHLIGAAWGKNIGDAIAALSIYLYCTYNHKIQNSWIEWNQQAFNRITSYLKYSSFMGLAGYIYEFCFYIITMIASSFTSKMEKEIQVIMYNCQQWHYNCFLGLHIVMINLLGSSLMSGNYPGAKKKILSGILLTLFLSACILGFIVLQKRYLVDKYTDIEEINDTVNASFKIYCAILFFDAIQLIYCGILKGVDMKERVIKVYLIGGLIGVILAVLLVFKYKYGILGLYVGWLTGTVICTISFIYLYAYSFKWLSQYQNIQKRMLKEKYAIKKEQEILLQQFV